MVYCGKPSKGCGQCRTRKIRCDQARPACSQCIRAKRECPGYRDQLALMFRDESTSVVKKAKAEARASSSPSSSVATRQKRSPARSPRTASPDGSSSSEMAFSVGSDETFEFNSDPQQIGPFVQPSNQLIQSQWQLPMEVQAVEPTTHEAVCFFLRSNAIPGSVWMSDFMTSFLLTPGLSPSHQAMQSSLTAVASAMFCRVKKLNSLKDEARREYANALSALNNALLDVKEAKMNQTLGAVVLLAIYEVWSIIDCLALRMYLRHLVCRS